jgi:putative two-component system response regulator
MENAKKTILVIDDVAENLIAIRTILQDRYELCLSRSGHAGLLALGRTKVDLILLDMEMPGMSGLEFMKEFRKNPIYAPIPVIFITATATPEVVSHAITSGIEGYVVKPINAELLLKKISAIFDAAVSS